MERRGEGRNEGWRDRGTERRVDREKERGIDGEKSGRIGA
jgi:hypothetical protein